MSTYIDRKCPVCGHDRTRQAGVYGDQRQCVLCGTTDSAVMFPETEMGNLVRTAPVKFGVQQSDIERMAEIMCDRAGCTWAFASENDKCYYRDTVIEMLQGIGAY